jgi:hypothetical protein
LNSLYRISVIIAALLITFRVDAQFNPDTLPTSNLRQKKIKVTGDTLRIDTASIIPNSFSIAYVPSSDYKLDFVKGYLVWKNKPVFN